MGARHPEGVLAAARDIRGQSLLDETAPDQARHPQLVLDDQHPHGSIVAPRGEREMTAADAVVTARSFDLRVARHDEHHEVARAVHAFDAAELDVGGRRRA